MTDTNISHCSFCGKHKDQVVKLIVGQDVAICNECVELCDHLLKDTIHNKHKQSRPAVSLDPREICEYLDQYVVGQDLAKIVLSVAIVNHYKRIDGDERVLNKANVLMIGPTGTGKTLLARTVAQALDVPFVIADATSLTEAGYVGDDVETMIARLYQAANGDIQKTQRGIVFIDEIDKIARKGESSTVSRDVSGEGVQQALLKLVEGTRCRIPAHGSKKSMSSETVEIDTSRILFIAGGAFVGIDSIVRNRVRGTAIGFAAEIASDATADLDQLTTDDIIRFGMIPEFTGRFPTVVTLKNLDKSQLINILTEVKNNFVEQYQWLFERDGVALEFDPESLDSIAERTMANHTGARGLHSELERVLLPHMFDLPRYRKKDILKVAINKALVNTPETLLKENQ